MEMLCLLVSLLFFLGTMTDEEVSTNTTPQTAQTTTLRSPMAQMIPTTGAGSFRSTGILSWYRAARDFAARSGVVGVPDSAACVSAASVAVTTCRDFGVKPELAVDILFGAEFVLSSGDFFCTPHICMLHTPPAPLATLRMIRLLDLGGY
jgi:hypothetical protein